ncbi:hypothetical protein Tco_0893850 [Tanacetum coccineum]|uniref:CCHC-type domain-containing protein n=1 Tax=Tanacetum coccineum TaxID=301880 RepID=A0ABQ5CCU6_9ASTR
MISTSLLTEVGHLDDCNVQATNIALQGLPPDVYSLINHCKTAKDTWDIVKLLMQGTELSYQERECKLYNEFDKFTSVKGESLHDYYLRFAQLINDMYTIGMTMQQVQVNTKFLNALQPEWSKFVTNVKLVKNLYNTNYDQLYAYLSQHEGHANEARLLCERYPNPLALTQLNHTPLSIPQNAYHSHIISQQPLVEFPQIDSGLVVLVFLPGDDPIAYLNKAMEFMSTVVASHFLSTNNQLRTSSNIRNQATIQDGRVTVQQVQRRHGQGFAGTRTHRNATSSGGNNAAGEARVVKCYNCQGKGHMARRYGQAIQTIIPQNAAFYTDDLDAYDSDCDDISSAKAVLMANLSSYGSYVLYEVPQHDTYQNDDMLTQKQALWLPLSNPKSEQLDVIQTPIEIEVPKELPKCSVDKKYFDIQKKELSLDTDRILDYIICQDVMNIVMHADSVPVNVLFANKSSSFTSLFDDSLGVNTPNNNAEPSIEIIPKNMSGLESITPTGWNMVEQTNVPSSDTPFVKNNWAKHGLKRNMMNTKGFFFFSFDTRAGLEARLEGVFEEDSFSLIASYIGKPIMLDSYTNSMCHDSWGRSSFVRCLIEVNSEADLLDHVTIGIPSLVGDGFIKENIRVEYE